MEKLLKVNLHLKFYIFIGQIGKVNSLNFKYLQFHLNSILIFLAHLF